MLTVTIDWLSVTFKEYTSDARSFILQYCSHPTVVPQTAHNGYNASHTDQNGVQVSWHTDRAEMGTHAVFSGSALRNLVTCDNVSSQSILRSAVAYGGNIVRLDIAKDLTQQEINLSEIYQFLQSPDRKGQSRTYGKIESNNGGYTIYVGSRQSDKFIRIYNKAAEQQLQGELWFRFEVEAKGLVAQSIANLLVDTVRWSVIFDRCVFSMVDFRTCKATGPFFTDENVQIGLPKLEKISDRERWISQQVIEAVAKHYIENPQSEAVSRLLATLALIDKQRKL